MVCGDLGWGQSDSPTYPLQCECNSKISRSCWGLWLVCGGVVTQLLTVTPQDRLIRTETDRAVFTHLAQRVRLRLRLPHLEDRQDDLEDKEG